MSELAGFVFHRAQRSVYLIEGLRHALEDLGRPDLIAMLELVLQDASQAKAASELALEKLTRDQHLRALRDLHALSGKVDAKNHRLIVRVARHIAAS